MATVNIQTGVLKQDQYLVADYSNAVSPFFQNGGVVAGALSVSAGDFSPSDTVQIDLAAATEITFAQITKEDGTVITHSVSAITQPRGYRVSFTAPSSISIARFLIIYKV